MVREGYRFSKMNQSNWATAPELARQFSLGCREPHASAKYPGNDSPFLWKGPKFSLIVILSFANPLRNTVAFSFILRVYPVLVISPCVSEVTALTTISCVSSTVHTQLISISDITLRKWGRAWKFLLFLTVKKKCFCDFLRSDIHETWARWKFQSILWKTPVPCPEFHDCLSCPTSRPRDFLL